jgi:hypothetical protein
MVRFILLRLVLLNHAFFIHPDAKSGTVFGKWLHTGSCVAVNIKKCEFLTKARIFFILSTIICCNRLVHVYVFFYDMYVGI